MHLCTIQIFGVLSFRRFDEVFIGERFGFTTRNRNRVGNLLIQFAIVREANFLKHSLCNARTSYRFGRFLIPIKAPFIISIFPCLYVPIISEEPVSEHILEAFWRHE